MSSYIFDLESDGFLNEATRLHSLVLKDVHTGKVFSYSSHDNNLNEGLERLSSADMIVGHNCIKFDIPLIQKLVPTWKVPKEVRDTLVLARLIHSNLEADDYARGTPKEIIGSHSLKAWGVRLGERKQDYQGGFDSWNPVMQEYCIQDVEVGYKLYWHLANRNYAERAIALEHRVAWLCAAMERNGFPFDMGKATDLYATLSHKREALKQSLQDLFPPWDEVDRVLIPKRDNKTLGYRKGVPVTKMKTVSFNPASRIQIEKCLHRKYGWKPLPHQLLESGRAQIDEDVLGSLHFPEAKRLAEFFQLNKLIGMLAEGKTAWLKKVSADGLMHPAYQPNGAVTGRATHAYPNIAQVPRVKKTKEGILKGAAGKYGYECRSLFTVPEGWLQLGSDMSGLELRCLGHYMAYYDKGEYAQEILNGDIHTKNMEAAGLSDRDKAKTFIYALLYGAGDKRLAEVLGCSVYKASQTRKEFFANVPALQALKDKVALSAPKGFLKGIDGREVYIRSEHAALNTLLQSTGALICKEWITLIDDALEADGWVHGWDGHYVFLAWVHDEVQIAVRPGIEKRIGETCVEMAAQAGRNFKFNCPLTAEFHTGRNWAETH